jgi:hypothetical protein
MGIKQPLLSKENKGIREIQNYIMATKGTPNT